MDNFAQVLREGKSKAGLNDETHPASSLKGLESACTSQLESFAAGVSIHVLSLTLITDDQRCFLSVTLVEFMLLSLVLTTIRPTHCAGV